MVNYDHTMSLIKINRRNLVILLNQRDTYTEIAVPVHIATSIVDTRAKVEQYKQMLRTAGYTVEDVPGVDFDAVEMIKLELDRATYERLRMIAEAYDIILPEV